MYASSSSLKWGRIALGVIVGVLVAVAGVMVAQLLWGVVLGFQLRGSPPQSALIAAYTSLGFQLVGALLALLGGILGGRFAAKPDDTKRTLAGLITGFILGTLLIAWRAFSWSTVDVWVIFYAVLAIAGGWIGAKLAARKTGEDYEAAPSL
jgi:hypothetical protein